MVLCVSHAHFIKSLATKLLERFVKLYPHLVELLVRRVTEPENSVAHSLKWLCASFVFEGGPEPFVKNLRVVTRVTFVMRCNNDQRKLVFAEFLGREVVEVDDFRLFNSEKVCLLV